VATRTRTRARLVSRRSGSLRFRRLCAPAFRTGGQAPFETAYPSRVGMSWRSGTPTGCDDSRVTHSRTTYGFRECVSSTSRVMARVRGTSSCRCIHDIASGCWARCATSCSKACCRNRLTTRGSIGRFGRRSLPKCACRPTSGMPTGRRQKPTPASRGQSPCRSASSGRRSSLTSRHGRFRRVSRSVPLRQRRYGPSCDSSRCSRLEIWTVRRRRPTASKPPTTISARSAFASTCCVGTGGRRSRLHLLVFPPRRISFASSPRR